MVTDATSSLPPLPQGRVELGTVGTNIRSVPIPVMIGDQIYSTGAPELDRELPLAVAQGAHVRTSRPSPGQLAATYHELRREGYAGAVSVHLSAKLSGTVDAAQLAARQTDLPVAVVDSRQAGLALGQAVIEAAITARLGAGLEETAEVAQSCARGSESLFVVQTLEQLRRSGRITSLASILGTLLWVKPLLGLRGGEVALLERPRTTERAVKRLTERAAEAAGQMPGARIGVHCFGNRSDGVELAAALQPHSSEPVPVVELPHGLAAHLGLGTLAVAVTPAAG